MYEDPQRSQFDYADLITNVRGIVDDLRGENGVRLIPAPEARIQASIVIPACDSSMQLESCIAGLNQLIVPAGKVELIIVNNGPSENYNADNLKRVSRLPLKILEKEGSEINVAKDIGVGESEGEYVAFLDADVVVTPLWLISLLSGFKDNHIAGVGATNLAHPLKTNAAERTTGNNGVCQPTKNIAGQVLDIFTGSALVRKDILQALGGFDGSQPVLTTSRYGLDLASRIRSAGYSLGHVEGEPTFS